MIFLNSARSAATLVFYLSCLCTHTDTEGEQRKARVRNNLKSSEKTLFKEHPVPISYIFSDAVRNRSSANLQDYVSKAINANLIRRINFGLFSSKII